MYAAAAIGVYLSGPMIQYQEGKKVTWNLDISQVVIALGIALLILPIAFAALKRDAPILIRLALFFQYGVFWRVVWGLAEKAIT